MTMDLTVETGNGDGSKRRNGWVMMAPNAETGNVDGSERWLRSDDERQTENSDGYECHTENSDDGSERQTENSDGSEHQYWKAMMALNAKTEKRWWLWTPKLNWK